MIEAPSGKDGLPSLPLGFVYCVVWGHHSFLSVVASVDSKRKALAFAFIFIYIFTKCEMDPEICLKLVGLSERVK